MIAESSWLKMVVHDVEGALVRQADGESVELEKSDAEVEQEPAELSTRLVTDGGGGAATAVEKDRVRNKLSADIKALGSGDLERLRQCRHLARYDANWVSHSLSNVPFSISVRERNRMSCFRFCPSVKNSSKERLPKMSFLFVLE